jgi:alanine-glyoxylate transaminase / serine-glyoxylate transaminase / serine-pyruvate transaminase
MPAANSSPRANAPTAQPRGRHFFFGPGPTNIPDSVLAAMHHTTMDFMAPDFIAIQKNVHRGIKQMLRTRQHLLMYAGNGHAAWEAALVNCFAPGETVLVLDCGFFANNWSAMATDLGYKVQTLTADWRRGVAATELTARLKADTKGEIKGVLVVHNETATGVVHPLADMRRAIDAAGHKALLLADAISSFGSIDIEMDAWGLDVVVAGSQKGLMMVTGMSLTGISDRALTRSATIATPRSYFNWQQMQAMAPQRFPGTSPVHMYLGLAESVRLIEDEGFDAVLARHKRLGRATRAAVQAWGDKTQSGSKSSIAISGTGLSGPIATLEVLCADPARMSDSVTTILVPHGHDANALRERAHTRYNLALGSGLGPLNGHAFRIGHLGDLNEPMLLGALATTELALAEAGIPHKPNGVAAAIQSLREPH